MVDCGNARCAQERRLFRKELMTWSKKLPLVVGLETIGERLAGEAAEDLFQPWRALEPQESADWEPEESCFYCDKKLKFLFESVSELEEDDVGSTTQEGLGVGYLNELLPYCSQYYTSSGTLDGSQPLDLSAGASRSPSRSTDGEMVSSGNRTHVELKIPQIRSQSKFRRDGFLNGKRSYTEEELVAAVGDIRSGKLGTRRAAALYGIPRSTLRNKIFKLESEGVGATDEEESLDEPSAAPTQLPLAPVVDTKMTLSELMQTSPFLLMPPIPLPIPVQHLEAHNNNNNHHHLQDFWDWRLEQIRRKHNLNGLKEQDEFHSACGIDMEVSKEEDASRSMAPSSSPGELKLTILPELVRRLTEQRVDMERCTGLPHQSAYDKTTTTPESNPVISAPSPHPSASPLRIPSFKPSLVASEDPPPQSKEGKAYECGKIGDTLKDIIAKTIAEKVRTRTHCAGVTNEKPNSTCLSPVAPTASQTTTASAFSIPSASSAKKSRKQPSPQNRKNNAEQSNSVNSNNSGKENNTASTQNGATGITPVKKTRPKRGQYRKYNSQLLMEAVKAVQRGEMSVHRAGSYFGVPHSTLEYKVKERHLLRQKKIKENQTGKQSAAGANNSANNKPSESAQQKAGEPTSSIASQTPAASAITTSPPKNEPSNGLLKFDPSRSLTSWLQHAPPNGLSYPPAALPPSPFTANFAISTPASELLKKLQQKVQNKSHSFCPEDSFLQSGFPRGNGAGLQDGFLFIK
ncbi:mushroom body large-type Kenyon cell-specific protein 1-like [Liolophura sinensis]|uniref:mushroom body large-type Kenyon cell-specific protein 1-like n=1 Tax=Liolophura sinensis TaxID=3198878 RepID=UPI0031584174